MDNPWKNVAVGLFLVIFVFVYSKSRTDSLPQQKPPVRDKVAVQQVQKEPAPKQAVKNTNRIAESKKQKTYAMAHAKSYDKLAETLEFIGKANEFIGPIAVAYHSESPEEMFLYWIPYDLAIKAAKESVRMAEEEINGIEIPSSVRSLHNKWISLIGDFKRLPDEYTDIMPKVIDGKAGAVEDAEALAIEMLELPQRAIDLSQKIENTFSF